MKNGLSFTEARSSVQKQNETRCISCGEVRSRGRKGYFCGKPECKKRYFRFRWYKTKGLTEHEALREALKAA